MVSIQGVLGVGNKQRVELWECFRQPLTCWGGAQRGTSACGECKQHRLTAAAGLQRQRLPGGSGVRARSVVRHVAPSVVALAWPWPGFGQFGLVQPCLSRDGFIWAASQPQRFLGWGMSHPDARTLIPHPVPVPQHLPERHEGVEARHPHREVPHDQARTRQTQRAQSAEVSELQCPG